MASVVLLVPVPKNGGDHMKLTRSLSKIGSKQGSQHTPSMDISSTLTVHKYSKLKLRLHPILKSEVQTESAEILEQNYKVSMQAIVL